MLGAAALAGLLAAGLMTPAPAAGQTVERDLMEFVHAQGTFDFFGILFVPPVPNFLGSSDPVSGLGMSVDYAGLADEACGGIAGTTFAGYAVETALPDGRAHVEVLLETSNAISWVVQGQFDDDGNLNLDFSNDPVIFGSRWEVVTRGRDRGQCVIPGEPALGNSVMHVEFIIPAPGDPLPDLFELVLPLFGLAGAFPEGTFPEGQELLAFEFEARAAGKLADGRRGTASTVQVSSVVEGELVFTEETILVKPAKK